MSNLSSSFSSTLRRSGSWKKTYTGGAKKIIKKRKNYELFRRNLHKLKNSLKKNKVGSTTEPFKRSYDHITGLEELRSKWEAKTGRIESMGSRRKLKSSRSRKLLMKKRNKKLMSHNKAMQKKLKLYIKFVDLVGDGMIKEVDNRRNRKLKKIIKKRKKTVKVKKVVKKVKKNMNMTKIKNKIKQQNFISTKIAPLKLQNNILKMAEMDVLKNFNQEKFLRKAWNRMKRTARRASRGARRTFRRAKRWVKKTVKRVAKAASSVWNRIKNAVRAAVNKAKAAAKRVLNRVKAGLTRAWNKAKSFGAKMWNKVKSLSSKIANFAKRLAKMPGMLLKKAWTSISNTFRRVGRWVSNSAKKVFSGIKTIASKAFKWIKGAVKTVSRGIKKFVTKGWTWIKNTAKKLFGFFKKVLVKIWNWFKKIMSRLFGFLKKLFSGKSLVAKFLRFMVKILLNYLGGPPGQMIARIKYLNGTLDKWWLMIPPLSLPPLSIVPVIFFMTNKIQKGVENDLPYDNGYMRSIALIGMSLPILELVFDTTWYAPFFALYVFGAWFFIYSMRDQKRCRQVRGRRDGYKPAKFLKTAANGALMFLILRDFIEILFAAMGKLPYIGSVITVFNSMPFVNVFVGTSTAAVITYILNNMWNNTPFTKYCNDYSMKKGTHRAYRSLVSLVIYFLLYSMNFRVKDMIKDML